MHQTLAQLLVAAMHRQFRAPIAAPHHQSATNLSTAYSACDRPICADLCFEFARHSYESAFERPAGIPSCDLFVFIDPNIVALAMKGTHMPFRISTGHDQHLMLMFDLAGVGRLTAARSGRGSLKWGKRKPHEQAAPFDNKLPHSTCLVAAIHNCKAAPLRCKAMI